MGIVGKSIDRVRHTDPIEQPGSLRPRLIAPHSLVSCQDLGDLPTYRQHGVQRAERVLIDDAHLAATYLA